MIAYTMATVSYITYVAESRFVAVGHGVESACRTEKNVQNSGCRFEKHAPSVAEVGTGHVRKFSAY